ncbi:DUF4158 domain-containing protein [Nonomuraea sp. NBC_00507]|uniref:DUF4158 domain-containing protein n=1 Tax=Nonomuraea sp. NBC_00507 TaxID=2976002 RepID=UPI003FA5B2BA
MTLCLLDHTLRACLSTSRATQKRRSMAVMPVRPPGPRWRRSFSRQRGHGPHRGHRGRHIRCGFALQLVTVRYLGRFLADPLEVPNEVLDVVAAQVGIEDPSCVKRYTSGTRRGWNTTGRSPRRSG